MKGARRSMGHVSCASLCAAIVVALLLAEQFATLSHSIGHDFGQSHCMVCGISKPYKQAVASLIATDPAALAGSTAANALLRGTLKTIVTRKLPTR